MKFNEFLDKYSLRVPFAPEEFIADGDIVEVYTEDFVQLYRNNNFFKYCSYDLKTLLQHPFDVLFRRDEEVTRKIAERALECLNHGKGIEPVGIEPHLMQEHFARNNRVFRIEHKYCSPVFSKVTGQVMGFFCSQRATPFGHSNVSGLGFLPG